MPFGITNATIVTYDNITKLTNFSGDPIKFAINSNHLIYNGYFYFIMLLVLWFILFRIIQEKSDQPLNNIMYSGIIVSLVAFFWRAIEMVTTDGNVIALLTDFQMWIFPLVTVLDAGIIWFIKR